ncbi:hypothetical protein SUNI508_02471 [Seiridium unicorne]|uniref:Uncharacterized protein n=1 Tax=Seiridium unicorne TaxID=138068 RepID=A0ABR2UF66_9PEZI
MGAITITTWLFFAFAAWRDSIRLFLTGLVGTAFVLARVLAIRLSTATTFDLALSVRVNYTLGATRILAFTFTVIFITLATLVLVDICRPIIFDRAAFIDAFVVQIGLFSGAAEPLATFQDYVLINGAIPVLRVICYSYYRSVRVGRATIPAARVTAVILPLSYDRRARVLSIGAAIIVISWVFSHARSVRDRSCALVVFGNRSSTTTSCTAGRIYPLIWPVHLCLECTP